MKAAFPGMTYEQALDQLVQWLDESLGPPIELPSGQTKGFRLTQDYVEDEVAEFEDEWQIEFPKSYRQFLLTVASVAPTPPPFAIVEPPGIASAVPTHSWMHTLR